MIPEPEALCLQPCSGSKRGKTSQKPDRAPQSPPRTKTPTPPRTICLRTQRWPFTHPVRPRGRPGRFPAGHPPPEIAQLWLQRSRGALPRLLVGGVAGDLDRLPKPAGSGAVGHPPSRCAEPVAGVGAVELSQCHPVHEHVCLTSHCLPPRAALVASGQTCCFYDRENFESIRRTTVVRSKWPIPEKSIGATGFEPAT